MNAITTKHKLDFEYCPWEPLINFPKANNYMRFRVGSIEGLWAVTDTSYDILAIENNHPGNGHFEDVLQWFEHSCKRDHKNLRFLEILNPSFRKHLINKRGFKPSGNNVIKKFK